MPALLVVLSFALIVLIGMLGWFLVRHVWPYVTAQFELTRQHRVREQEQLLSVLGSYAKTTEGTRIFMGQMQEILSLQTGAIQRLADEVDRASKRKQKPRGPVTPPKDTL